MSILKRILDLLSDGNDTDDMPELDQLSVPPTDILNSWLHTLNDDTKASVLAMATELHHSGKDALRFVAIVRHLCQEGAHLSSQSILEIARRKVAPLMARFEGIAENEWTEAQLDQWISGLDDFWRNAIYDRVRSYTRRGGTDLVTLLCALRRLHEARERQEEAEARRNRPSLLHLWYIWQEEGRKMEQHEYFKRENRKARDR